MVDYFQILRTICENKFRGNPFHFSRIMIYLYRIECREIEINDIRFLLLNKLTSELKRQEY
ncbi:MAG: hypothetical protein C4527_28985 [Candidatus Omnitrophota bacterium]|jgi:dolichol kinase|nr:MAG: hypothetical protein C4527_28985 [Candidatus Omnitrophota bacterium]